MNADKNGNAQDVYGLTAILRNLNRVHGTMLGY
jgi:hypothetical protein